MLQLSQAQLNQLFTVETVMTPRQTWTSYELATANERARDSHDSFDVVPVEDVGQVVGVMLQQTQAYYQLTEKWLVSRDMPIPQLLDLFIRTGQKAFLVVHHEHIFGIVTPADFNKLPVRVYIYNIIAELEMALAEHIRAVDRRDHDTLLRLLGDRTPDIQQTKDDARAGNVDVDIVEYLDLSDLVLVVEKSAELRAQLGYPSRKAAEKALGGVVALRHHVMHTVRPLIIKQHGEDGLDQLQARLQIAIATINSLAESRALAT